MIQGMPGTLMGLMGRMGIMDCTNRIISILPINLVVPIADRTVALALPTLIATLIPAMWQTVTGSQMAAAPPFTPPITPDFGSAANVAGLNFRCGKDLDADGLTAPSVHQARRSSG